METIKLTNWADYDDCGNPDGTDAWNLSDGSVDAYPGMTPEQVASELGKNGWERDLEREQVHSGTDFSGIYLTR